MSATVVPPDLASTPSSGAAKTRAQRLCAQSGFLLLGFFGAGMILARYIPPPGANQSTAQLVNDYAHHTTTLRIGLTLMIIASGFYATWSGAVSVQLKRLEGTFSPFAYTELACGAANMLVIMLPLYVLLAAAFRPLRDPQITRALNDVAMIPFIGALMPTVISCLVIAGAILSSDRTDVYPRWVAWFNLVCIPLLLPALAIPFFKSGALAWQGVLEFWLAVVVFFGWFLVMTLMTLRAIKGQENTTEPVTVA